MDITILRDFLEVLDDELSNDEMAVIRCLNEHLIDYMPEHKKDAQSINSEINRVIDNYRLMAFEWTLLNKRLDGKYKNKNYDVDIQTKKEGK